ncbi:MAG: BON domain-containing protein [Dysgonamonadaceae bacterium]|nr:BON domain-containing protein [Dysgonamonadaceae bacterium]
MSDADLQSEIQQVLATNPDAEDVAVTVSDKVVTLAGTVKDDAAKAAIDSIVASVKHVKSVVNELEVVPPAPDYSELDQIIEASLPEILVEYPKLTASVEDGVVTLSGEGTQAEIDNVMTKIQELNPVDIVNETTVKN